MCQGVLGACRDSVLRGQKGYRGIRGHWGAPRGVGAILGVSGVYWGWLGLSGLRGQKGYKGIRGHLGAPRGCQGYC